MATDRFRIFVKGIGVLALAVVVLMGAIVAWLYATAPGAGEAKGWFLGEALPSARGELATAVAHARPCPEPPCPDAERLYVVGGLSGLGRAQDEVASYDPTAGRWSAEPRLPVPRHHLAAAGLDEALYVSGGTADRGRPWTPESDLWRLNSGSDAWERLAPMPEPRWGHRMVVHDGRLYVVGGQGPTSRVLIYTPGDGWRTGAKMPVQRDHLSAVVADGRIWTIGGRAPGSLVRVDLYDPEADRWEPGPDLPEPTSGAAEGVLDGVILIFGGEEPDLFRGEVFDRHWMLDTGRPAPGWRPAPPPPAAVHGADGTVFQGTLVIAGGATRHGFLSVTAWTDAVQWLDAAALEEIGVRIR